MTKSIATTVGMLLVGVVSFLSGCGDNSGTATLNVYQESPNLDTIQVLWNSQTVASNLAYQQNTGPLKITANGTLVFTGMNVKSTSPTQPQSVQTQLNLTPNSTNDFIIYGPSDGLQTVLLTADTTPAEDSAAKLRVENCVISGVPEYVVYVLPSGKTPSGNPTYNGQFGCGPPVQQVLPITVITPTYQVLSPGAYDIFFTLEGTTQIWYKTTVTLAANQNRTLVLIGGCGSSCEQASFISLLLDDLN